MLVPQPYRPCAHLCLLVAALLAPSLADDNHLPLPISVAPDQNWEGIDGSWNTFSLRLGTPYQPVHVFVSTASQQTWTVAEYACMRSETDSATNTITEKQDTDCWNARGWTFNSNTSSSWRYNGFYQLWIEKNLDLAGNGQYGWDTVGLGLPGEEGPTLPNTTVGTIISSDFWLGHFGVNPKPTNFTNFTDPSPSYMTLLFEQNQIPSVSFGYTAGAQYHDTSVLGSLTLGGYDASRFIQNDLTWNFAPDNERDLVVGIVDISATSSTKSNISLLNRDPFSVYIDSTVAELWLPVAVCEAFEDAFGLVYDNNTGLYLVDDQLHDRLKAESPSISFLLGQKYSTNATINITLPYNAFDLQASPPYKGLTNVTNYFPIRRATRDNQFTLGRTFLQESYLTVDWERQNFSISECNWVLGENKNIVSIVSPKYTGEYGGSSSGLSTGAIIGIAVGIGLVVIVAVGALFLWFRRRRQRQMDEMAKLNYAGRAAAAVKESSGKKEDPLHSPAHDSGVGHVFPKAELPADSKFADAERKDADSPTSFGRLVEAENTERPIYEMEGDVPGPNESGGRQLSEKETMRVREARYNGVDPSGTPDASPRSDEEPPQRHRPAPLTGLDVAMVNRRLPVSPVTPLTPRTRDGASLEAGDTFFQPLQRRTLRDGSLLEAEDTLLSPVSPLDGPTETSRRRFSYES
ncbi:acid protease [Karstenula rhodostoma CBS 690.94]|uniref:Acid protease n=1 Tax=Karstenula rhodostoma CBS 690.94 TaxID=1392251 RepID=A0A9P4PA64_9PLEO|nr:acid protease [Karstenula rhodostoma CBS 690.94]